MLHKRLLLLAASCGLCTTVIPSALAQNAPGKPMSGAAITAAAGDSNPDSSGMATLSPAIEKAAIEKALHTVAEWQMKNAEGKYNQDWTYGPLYLGYLAASEATGDKKYHDEVLKLSEGYQWKLWADRNLHADDEAIAQSYEKLYREKKDPVRIADAKATFDRLVAYKADPNKDLWWWCDALFMAPAGLVEMSNLTGDHKYTAAMDREWALTQQHLYDPKAKLFYRDATYFGKHEANGENIYWTRGNGWVLAGTANVLKAMPKNDPLRPKYIALFKEMAARIAELQQPDGLWKPSLLDPTHYPLPEISGSAFFTYAMVWGVNNGILDRKTYGPVIEKAWAGMLKRVYADGRLGCIQPIGAAPGAFTESSSYVYGVGAFLMTGNEMKKYAKH